jgi:hypothetical protein
MAGLRLSAEARGSRAVCTERYKKPSDDRPRCLENPRPEGAESYLTGNAALHFPLSQDSISVSLVRRDNFEPLRRDIFPQRQGLAWVYQTLGKYG